MCKDFKNPDEGESEDSELADVDVYENMLVGADDVSLSDLETDGDVELLEEDISDDSFDPNASDSDDSMPGQSINTETSQDQAIRPITCMHFDELKEQVPINSVSGDEEAGPSTTSSSEKKNIVNVNLEKEDDETVRAIVDAISKPRSIPPEIKLDDFITDICFHPMRDIIAMATITGDIALYKYANESNTLLRNIEVHAKACRDVEFSDDGRSLLSCSKDKSIMVTDMETEKLKNFYESAHDDAINKLFVIDDNLFATGDDNGTVRLWDLRIKDRIFSLKEVEDYITRILTNDTKKLLLITSGDGYLTTINIGSRKLYVQSEPYEEELTCMGLYRGDSKLIVGTSKGRLYTYNWGQFGYHCDMYPGVKSPISEMIPITDRIACIAGEEGTIRACHIAPFRVLGVVGQHTMPIETLDVSSNGELIASSSHNNDVRFWNVKYFEEFGDVKYNEKHNTFMEMCHNLPSSKFSNASDFFADLRKAHSDDDD